MTYDDAIEDTDEYLDFDDVEREVNKHNLTNFDIYAEIGVKEYYSPKEVLIALGY